MSLSSLSGSVVNARRRGGRLLVTRCTRNIPSYLILPCGHIINNSVSYPHHHPHHIIRHPGAHSETNARLKQHVLPNSCVECSKYKIIIITSYIFIYNNGRRVVRSVARVIARFAGLCTPLLPRVSRRCILFNIYCTALPRGSVSLSFVVLCRCAVCCCAPVCSNFCFTKLQGALV